MFTQQNDGSRLTLGLVSAPAVVSWPYLLQQTFPPVELAFDLQKVVGYPYSVFAIIAPMRRSCHWVIIVAHRFTVGKTIDDFAPQQPK